MRRIATVLVGVTALALIAAGCGDDDDPEDVANDLLSDFDDEFTDLSDLSIDEDAFSDLSDFTDFSDVSDFGGFGATGVCADAEGDEDIGAGDSAEGEISDPGDVVGYGFSGDGDTHDIAVEQTDEQFDPVVSVCDSDGNEVDRNDDGPDFPNSLLEDFDAEDGEDYVIVVSGFSQSTGEYEISVS